MKERLTDHREGEGFGRRASDFHRIGAEMLRQRKLAAAGSTQGELGDIAPVAPDTGDASISVLPNIGIQATAPAESQPAPIVEPNPDRHSRW